MPEHEQRVPSKDDPLNSGNTTFGGRTVWLDRDNMELARANFWRQYHELDPSVAQHDWDVAWAAAIAAYSYLMEGRLE
jgi:hypothetical protein